MGKFINKEEIAGVCMPHRVQQRLLLEHPSHLPIVLPAALILRQEARVVAYGQMNMYINMLKIISLCCVFAAALAIALPLIPK